MGVHPDLRSLKYIMDRQKSTQELEQYDMFLQIPKSEIHSIGVHMQNPFLLIDRMLM